MEIVKMKNESSVSVEKNSRGFTYKIKAYGENPKEISEKLDSLTNIAHDKIKKLEEAEPHE